MDFEQYEYMATRRGCLRDGERQLMLAVLIDALGLAAGVGRAIDPKPVHDDVREEAYEWIMGIVRAPAGGGKKRVKPVPDDPERLFSCANICAVFGLDYGAVKESMRHIERIDKELIRRLLYHNTITGRPLVA